MAHEVQELALGAVRGFRRLFRQDQGLLPLLALGDVADGGLEYHLSPLLHPSQEHVGGKLLAADPPVRPLEE